MKTCSECGCELKTTLDIYGSSHEVLCRSCFLNGKEKINKEKIAIEEDIEFLEEVIKNKRRYIEELKNQIQDYENNIFDLKRRRENLKDEERKKYQKIMKLTPNLL